MRKQGGQSRLERGSRYYDDGLSQKYSILYIVLIQLFFYTFNVSSRCRLSRMLPQNFVQALPFRTVLELEACGEFVELFQ